MVQEILPLLPKEAGTVALAVAVAGTLVGAGLWLVGSRFSRSLITLFLVTAGALIGTRLPQWFGWPIADWATALGGALVLGAAGYVFHKVWVGVGLGTVLMAWAALGIWLLFNGDKAWTCPDYLPNISVLDYLQLIWQHLPPDVVRILPFICGAAMVSGLAAALVWPRVGVVLLYSSAGVSLLAGMGLFAMQFTRPQWVGLIPARQSSQVGVLLGMVLFGALLQWWIAPAKKTSGKSKGPSNPLVFDD